MTTEKQLQANRANATRSTGPKTASGKAKSRGNAWKHGLTAKSLVIGDEQPAQFARLQAQLEAEFKPETAMEHLLVDRLAGLMWRLRRVPEFEAAVINFHLEVQLKDFLRRSRDASPDLGLALINDAERQDMLGKLSRYEASLMSSLSRTLHLLQALRGQQEPKTVAGSVVDIVALPSPKAHAA